jgi:hypothetical protein
MKRNILFFILLLALMPQMVIVAEDIKLRKTALQIDERINDEFKGYSSIKFYYSMNKLYDFSRTNLLYKKNKKLAAIDLPNDTFVDYVLAERQILSEKKEYWVFRNYEKLRASFMIGLTNGIITAIPTSVYIGHMYSDIPFNKLYMTDNLAKDIQIMGNKIFISDIQKIANDKLMFYIENIQFSPYKGNCRMFFIISKIENSIFTNTNGCYEINTIYVTVIPKKDDSISIVKEMESKTVGNNNEIRKIIHGAQDTFIDKIE